ncbi:MAG: GNAT family N-acetyltransferase [Steroidobacteraceae bacterium]|nr:GNAT family N-acetyltransferase [Steroidobacteraceae bacterium]
MSTSHDDSKPRLTTTDVRREERGTSGGRWVGNLDGHEAEMTYSRASAALIIIDHTSVPDALRGRGVGPVLVQRAVEDARREGFKILPLCPFAKAQFERHPEWGDVL